MKIKTKLYLSTSLSIVLISLFILATFILFNDLFQESGRVKLNADMTIIVSELNIILTDYLLLHKHEGIAEQWKSKYDSGLTVLQKASTAEEENMQELIYNITGNYL